MFFSIDEDNAITAHETIPMENGLAVFRTEEQFAKAIAEWPINRLVDIWNGFAGAPPFGGLKPVKKFENKTKATRRIWQAIQVLAVQPIDAAKVREMVDGAIERSANIQAPADLAACPGPAKSKKAPGPSKKAAKSAGEPKAPREGTAKATVLAMIQRKGGATLEEIMKATGWQAHTCRGFMSVAPKKAGLTVISTRRESDKARVYEVAR